METKLKIGDRVRFKGNSIDKGKIAHTDGTGIPYFVHMDAGFSAWYKEEELIIEEKPIVRFLAIKEVFKDKQFLTQLGLLVLVTFLAFSIGFMYGYKTGSDNTANLYNHSEITNDQVKDSLYLDPDGGHIYLSPIKHR